MELINATQMLSEFTLGMDTSGRERVVVVVKGTFDITDDVSEPRLSDEQVPPLAADLFTGEPGLSSTLYESDFAPFKARCDVLLHGNAYAPNGRPSPIVRVAMSVGRMLKGFDVVGDRVWTKTSLGRKLISDPLPFTQKPITYDKAFGGIDVHPQDPKKVSAYDTNPVGVGYYPHATPNDLMGRPLANTTELDTPVDSPKGAYRPMSFGPIGRNFQPRASLAGTYDEQWLDEVFPFLPSDFNPLYFQCAPPDQQIPYPEGGDQIVLRNLTPNGRISFHLPRVEVPVEFSRGGGQRMKSLAALDTVVIEPEAKRFLLTWRASSFLKKSLHEIKQIVVGEMPRAWYRARETGKTYYPSLAELVRHYPRQPRPAARSAPEKKLEQFEIESAPTPRPPPPLEPVPVEPPPIKPVLAEKTPTEYPESKEEEYVDSLASTMVWEDSDKEELQRQAPSVFVAAILQIGDEYDDPTETLTWEADEWQVRTAVDLFHEIMEDDEEGLEESSKDVIATMKVSPEEPLPEAPPRMEPSEGEFDPTQTVMEMSEDMMSILAQIPGADAPPSDDDQATEDDEEKVTSVERPAKPLPESPDDDEEG